MKHVLLTGFILLALGACKKGNDDNTQEPKSHKHFIKYKVNGQQVVHEGAWQSAEGSVEVLSGDVTPGIEPAKKMRISARTPVGYRFSIDINSDSLKTGDRIEIINLSDKGGIFILLQSKSYTTFAPFLTPPFSMTVHIDKHAEGWISGTFSGKLGHLTSQNPDVYDQAIITEGSFSSNVVYK